MNRHDINHLMQYNSAPALTITLPTHRTAPENRQDRIRLANLVSQAREMLLASFERGQAEAVLSRLEPLVQSVNLRQTLDGLVILASATHASKYYLPFSVPERVHVSDSFLLRDLVFAINRHTRYWVLVLSEKPTRLLEGTRDTLIEIQEGGFPMVHEGPGGAQALPGGFGIQKSAYRDEMHRQFFRQVDGAFQPFVRDDPLPLVLVGVNRYLSFYREVSTSQEMILTTLNGSHDKTPLPRLAKRVWPLVEQAMGEKRKEYLADLSRAVGERKSGSTMEHVWRLANEGRGRLLLVEENYHFPGRLDETGINLLPAGPGDMAAIPDAVDDVIETVLSKGGQVVFVPDGALEEHQRIALITRY